MSKWPLTKIGKFLTPRQTAPDPEKIASGEFSIVSKISFASGQIELRDHAKTNTNMITIMPGDLVVSGINAGKGAIAIYGKENKNPATATIHYSSYEVNSDLADIEYLWYFFRSEVFREILRLGLPNGIKTELRPNKFITLEITLPPLPEQKRIVKKIKEIEERVNKLKDINNKRSLEVQAIVDSLINSKFVGIPKRELDEKNDFVFSTRGKGPEYSQNSDAICLNQKCNRWNKIDLSHAKTVSKKWFEGISKEMFTREEDVIINSTGDGTVGRASLVTKEHEGLIYDSHILLIRLNKNKIDPRFFVKIFNSRFGQQQVEDNISAKTTKQTELGMNNLMKTKIPDISIDEQKSIFYFFNKLEQKVNDAKKIMNKEESYNQALMPSILSKAFNGEL